MATIEAALDAGVTLFDTGDFYGLSEMGAATVRRAAKVHRIVHLQIEYSLVSRGIEREILPAARELGIEVTAYGVLSPGEDIVPLIGARTRAQLADALGGLRVSLTREDLARIETAVPAGAVAGGRYAPAQMAMLDSERRQAQAPAGCGHRGMTKRWMSAFSSARMSPGGAPDHLE